MNITCRSCGREIPAADINVSLALAKCVDCNTLFRFTDQLPPTEAEAQAWEKPVVSLPRGYQVDEWGGELTIRYRWPWLAGVGLLFFCVFWDGFLVVWYSIAIAQQQWLMMVFPLLHVAVGVGLTYAALGMLLNRTVIRVTGGELTVRHGPVPYPGNRRLFTADIDQLFCREHTSRGKHGPSYTYELHLRRRDGEIVKLLTGLTDSSQALFLEQKLEEHLGIDDESVPGELRW